jgi:hypothetical protein
MQPSGFESGLSIENLDASKSIPRLVKHSNEIDAEKEMEEELPNLHILDLKMPTAALTGGVYSLSSAFEVFGEPASWVRDSRPRVNKPAIGALLRNIDGELELLNRFTQSATIPCNLFPVIGIE